MREDPLPLIYSCNEAHRLGIPETKRCKRPAIGYAQGLLNKFLRQYDGSQIGRSESELVCAGDNRRIKELRSSLPIEIKADCWFGENTNKATRMFQLCHGLKADGKIGENTWPRLEETKPVLPVCSEKSLIDTNFSSGMAPPERPCKRENIGCRVRRFCTYLRGFSGFWPGPFGYNKYLNVSFELELEKGSKKEDCVIGQKKRGRVEMNSDYGWKNVDEFKTWTTDGPSHWWDGSKWSEGAGHGSWSWLGGRWLNEIASFRDEPGFHSNLLMRVANVQLIWGKNFPLYYGGVGRNGYFIFRTWVGDKSTGKTVTAAHWGMLIDYAKPSKGRATSKKGRYACWARPG